MQVLWIVSCLACLLIENFLVQSLAIQANRLGHIYSYRFYLERVYVAQSCGSRHANGLFLGAL